MSLNSKLDEIKSIIGLIEEQIEQLEEHNVKACSTKARSLLQKVKTECHSLRADCLDFVKAMSKSKPAVKEPVAEEPVAEEPVAEEPVAEEKPKRKSPKRKTKVK